MDVGVLPHVPSHPIRSMKVDFLELFQAVFKQFGAGGYGSDNVVPDEAELQHHQKLEKLYISTRAAKVIETLCVCVGVCACLHLDGFSESHLTVEIFCCSWRCFLMFSAFSKRYCSGSGRLHCYWVQTSWDRCVGEALMYCIGILFCQPRSWRLYSCDLLRVSRN